MIKEKEIYITQEKYHKEIPELMIATEIDGSEHPKERFVIGKDTEKETFLEKDATGEAKLSGRSKNYKQTYTVNKESLTQK